MQLFDYMDKLKPSDRIRIFRDSGIIFSGYIAVFEMEMDKAEDNKIKKISNENPEIESIETKLEIFAKRWEGKEPQQPIDTSCLTEYEFTDLKILLQHEIYLN